MNCNKNSIGENAGIVWRALYHNEMSWEELLKNTELPPLELAGAIGWLARENKINMYSSRDIIYFSIYHEHYF